MNVNEYLSELANTRANAGKISEIEKIYGKIQNELVIKIISYAAETVFFNNSSVLRSLSFDEIKDANAELHVSFTDMNLIPLFDCGDNDFIVYHTLSGIWSKFNIVDQVTFKKCNLLADLFQ